MLECSERSDNSFVTLTYSDENLPPGGTLRPRDLQLFMKRLRKAFGGKLRYYGVGEYGDKSERPHYHLALFGYPQCSRGMTAIQRNGKCCQWCDLVAASWGLGRIFIGELNEQTAAYVAQYVTKKLTSKEDPALNGRHPEFARMSNRPGIGGDFADEVASTLLTYGLDKTLEDVPISLRHGARELPLGQYMRKRIRKRIGRDEKTPQTVLDKSKEELSPVFQAAETVGYGKVKTEVTNILLRESKGRRIQLEKRARFFQPKKDVL